MTAFIKWIIVKILENNPSDKGAHILNHDIKID